jgi:excisionase family DNA binding protein
MEALQETLTGTTDERWAANVERLPHLLDVAGVAEVLGVTVRHVRRLVADRRIPYLKWGHYIRFDPDDIHRWLDESRVDAAGRDRSRAD